jgi:methyl-accepting chemotaxis protein
MKSGKLNTVLLALIFVVLLLHLVAPIFRAQEAAAIGRDSVSPAEEFQNSQNLALTDAARQIADGLRQVAQANQQIANAITQEANSTARVAASIDKVSGEMRERQSGQ